MSAVSSAIAHQIRRLERYVLSIAKTTIIVTSENYAGTTAFIVDRKLRMIGSMKIRTEIKELNGHKKASK